MSTTHDDLLDDLRALAEAWDRTAPAIRADEVVAHRTGPVRPAPAAMLPAPEARRRPRRPARAALVGAAAAAVVVAGLVAIGDRSAEAPAPGTPGPVDTAGDVATTVAGPDAPTSGPPLDDERAAALDAERQRAERAAEREAQRAQDEARAATSTLPPTADLVAAVQAERADTLGRLGSYRATFEVRRGDVVTVHRVWARADGSLWIEGVEDAAVVWGSYDASTGTARSAFADPSGVERFEEIVGWTDGSTPLGIVAGSDPTAPLGSSGVVRVEATTSHLGQPAWVAVVDEATVGIPRPSAATITTTIDRASGLVVDRLVERVVDGVVQVERSTIVDLELDVALPDAFPGAFPPGADVARSGDPDGFAGVGVDAAIAAFGTGLLLPEGLPDGARITTGRLLTCLGDRCEQADVDVVEVTIDLGSGFVRSEITLRKTLAPAWLGEAPLPAGYALEGDGVCFSTDGVTCASTDGDRLLGGDGALAGVVGHVQDGFLATRLGAVEVTVAAATDAAAIAVAESLVAVS